MAGPPVSKLNVEGPVTRVPESDFKSGLSAKRQLIPASRSASKSYTQLRVSAHRPWPAAGQSTVKGSSRRGSPSATIDALNRAVTWRTCFTCPSGEKDSTSTVFVEAGGLAASATIGSRPASAARMRTSDDLIGSLRTAVTRGGSCGANLKPALNAKPRASLPTHGGSSKANGSIK